MTKLNFFCYINVDVHDSTKKKIDLEGGWVWGEKQKKFLKNQTK